MMMPIFIAVMAILLIVSAVLTVKKFKQAENKGVLKLILDFVHLAVLAAVTVLISLEYYEVIASKYTYICLALVLAINAVQLLLSHIRGKKDK